MELTGNATRRYLRLFLCAALGLFLQVEASAQTYSYSMPPGMSNDYEVSVDTSTTMSFTNDLALHRITIGINETHRVLDKIGWLMQNEVVPPILELNGILIESLPAMQSDLSQVSANTDSIVESLNWLMEEITNMSSFVSRVDDNIQEIRDKLMGDSGLEETDDGIQPEKVENLMAELDSTRLVQKDMADRTAGEEARAPLDSIITEIQGQALTPSTSAQNFKMRVGGALFSVEYPTIPGAGTIKLILRFFIYMTLTVALYNLTTNSLRAF